MQIHAEVTVFDVSPLTDASRAGRWLDVQLWRRDGLVPRMLADIKLPAQRDIARQAAEVAEHLVRWLALEDVDAVALVAADVSDPARR